MLDPCGVPANETARSMALGSPTVPPLGHDAQAVEGVTGLGAARSGSCSRSHHGRDRGGEGEGGAGLGGTFAGRCSKPHPVFLPAPHFAFMRSKFFMNHLYFSFSSPLSFCCVQLLEEK